MGKKQCYQIYYFFVYDENLVKNLRKIIRLLDLILLLTIEAKREAIVALLLAEVLYPQIIKKARTSLSIVKSNLKAHTKLKLGLRRKTSVVTTRLAIKTRLTGTQSDQ